MDFFLPTAPCVNNSKISRGKHLISPPFPKSGKSGAAVFGERSSKIKTKVGQPPRRDGSCMLRFGLPESHSCNVGKGGPPAPFYRWTKSSRGSFAFSCCPF